MYQMDFQVKMADLSQTFASSFSQVLHCCSKSNKLFNTEGYHQKNGSLMIFLNDWKQTRDSGLQSGEHRIQEAY